MSQGVMQMKNKLFVAAVVFVMFFLFAFFVGGFRPKFFGMARPNLIVIHGSVGNDAYAAAMLHKTVATEMDMMTMIS